MKFYGLKPFPIDDPTIEVVTDANVRVWMGSTAPPLATSDKDLVCTDAEAPNAP